MTLPQLDIERLTAEERIELAEALWESLRETPDQVPLTAVQERELDRRVAEYREDAQPGRPWREVLDEIRARKG